MELPARVRPWAGALGSLAVPPAFPEVAEKVLSDAQAADLFAYIKSMPESPAADKIPLLSRIMSEK